jgi:N-acetylglucosaminyldiphosphoundecaprenol N-acetyl-beta-D-mannosaminyltransferase
MSLVFKEIFGVPITTSKKQYILEEIRKYLNKGQKSKIKSQKIGVKPLMIYTPNPEIINFAVKNIFFRNTVRKAQINLPDGIGVVWAMEKLYKKKIDRITGVEMFEDLISLAAQKGFRIGLIGGKPYIALKAVECLRKKYKNLKISVFPSPQFYIKDQKMGIRNYELGIKDKNTGTQKFIEDLGRQINENKIDILFVALGFPKQEMLINGISDSEITKKRSKPLVLMSIGGTLDYVSGAIPRAPKPLRNIGLEWLFRLVIEPKRIIRQLKGGQFFFRVFLHN